LAEAVAASYAAQRAEGMAPLPGDPDQKASSSQLLVSSGSLPVRPLAWKYCGGGFGGYALYLCATPAERDQLCTLPDFHPVEPFLL